MIRWLRSCFSWIRGKYRERQRRLDRAAWAKVEAEYRNPEQLTLEELMAMYSGRGRNNDRT